MVTFMQDKIRNLGGTLDKTNIICRKCPQMMHSGFDPDYGILLCANHVRKKYKLEDAMAHGTSVKTPA